MTLVDILIIAPGTDPDQYYATGLALHSPFITLVRGKKKVIAAGGFEYGQAKRKHPDTVRFETLGKTFAEIVKAFCKKYRVLKPLMPASTRADIYKLVPGAQLSGNVFPQRAVKSAQEIRHIRLAQKGTEQAILSVREALQDATVRKGKVFLGAKPLNSEHLKTLAAQELAKFDCTCPDMIISSGWQSALPHHTGAGQLREGAVIVDIFPQSASSRYFADCTRTFVVGTPPKTFSERFEAVLAVQKKAIANIKHGVIGPEQSARAQFTELGFATDFARGTGYIHSLGHGVGLEIHEDPRLRERLVAGNVVTVEPGLYYDYGIRLEDIGVVTKKGFTNFTKLKRDPYL